MVKRRYGDPRNPRTEFEAMRPAYASAIKLMRELRPFGSDYLILHAVTEALTTAAFHFLRDPDFFGADPPGSVRPPRQG
jgi:hypothetical protein